MIKISRKLPSQRVATQNEAIVATGNDPRWIHKAEDNPHRQSSMCTLFKACAVRLKNVNGMHKVKWSEASTKQT